MKQKHSHIYNKCPKCKFNFKGKLIPKKDRKFFGNVQFFRAEIAIYDQALDRTVAWRCPKCEFWWERS